MKNSKPLVIYIAETNHGDLSYSSLLKQIVESCEEQKLNTQIFSEFPSQTKKVESQNLINKPDTETHEATTKFLDQKMTPMGDLANRNNLYNKSWESYSETITPSQLFEHRKENIDNPEIFKIMESEIEDRKLNGRNNPGKQEGGDLHDFNRLRTGLHFKQLHEEMAQDVTGNLRSDTDVVIMIAGGPHIPGLGNQLESGFAGCEKLVVGNFPNSNDTENLLATGGKEPCLKVGKLVGFEVEEGSNKALIPEEIKQSIHNKSVIKKQGNDLAALDLAATDSQIESLKENEDEAIKGFAEKIRPSKIKSNNTNAAGHLAQKDLSFVDRIKLERSNSSIINDGR